MSGCSSKAATIQKQESKRKRDPDQELYYYLPSLKYCACVNQILGHFQPMVLQGKVKPIKTLRLVLQLQLLILATRTLYIQLVEILIT